MIPSKEEQKYQVMVTSPIPKLVTSLAIPASVSTLITVIYNAADTYFVSQINESASAAVGVVYSIMAVIQAVGFGIAMGAGSLISRRLGEKKNKEASTYVSSGFAAALLIGLLVGLGGLFVLEPLLKLIGCSQTMLPYALPYAKIVLIGAPISCSTFVLNNALRAEGNTKLAMWGTAAGGVLNIILDPIFIFSLNLGSGGAALATVISQGVSFLIQIFNFITNRTLSKIHPAYISRKGKDYLAIFSTGLPTIFRQGLGSLSATALNISAVAYGDATVAAITIANKVYTLVRNLIMGIGQGFQPVAGYNYGAGYKKRAFQAFVFSTKLGTAVCVISAVIIAIFAEPLMWWFCDSEAVAVIGTQTLLLSCAVMPLLAFSTFVNQLYQCLGFKTVATLLASCRQGIFFFPAILLLPKFLERVGVQATQPVADLLTFLVSIPFAIRFYRREIKNAEK